MLKAVIWGAGNIGKTILFSLPINVEVVAFVDSNSEKVGTTLFKVPVVAISEISAIAFDIIYIANTHGEKIRAYLIENHAVAEDRIVDVLNKGNLDQRRSVLKELSIEIYRKKLSGSVAEVGVFRGDFAQYINRVFSDKPMYLFDTFAGFPDGDLSYDIANTYSNPGSDLFKNTTVELVKDKLLYKENCIFKVGYFPDSAAGLEHLKYCFVSIDLDLYKPIYNSIEYFYDKLEPGGYIMVHDYNNDEFKGVKTAVLELAEKLGFVYFPIADSGGSVVIGK